MRYTLTAFAIGLLTAATPARAQWNTADVGQTSKSAHRGMFGDRATGVPLEAPRSQFRSGLQRGPSGNFYGRAPYDRPLMFSPRMEQSPLLPPLNQPQLSGTQALEFSRFVDRQNRLQRPDQAEVDLRALLEQQQSIEKQLVMLDSVKRRIQTGELPADQLRNTQRQIEELQLQQQAIEQQAAEQQNVIAQQERTIDDQGQLIAEQQAALSQQQAALAEQQAALAQQIDQQQAARDAANGTAPPVQEANGATPPAEEWFRGATEAAPAPPAAAPAPADSGATRPGPAPYTAAFMAPQAGNEVRGRELSARLASNHGIRASSPIAVSVISDTAVLQGTVATSHDRQLAELMLLLEPGIAKVDNRLQVSPSR